MSLPLNINIQQIFLHLFNFVILFAILYFLLYKPVKKFMDERIEYYKKVDDEAKLNLEASEKTKEEYLEKLASAEEEISAKKEKARKDIEAANAIRIKEAENKAKKIIDDAYQTTERQHEKMLSEAKNEISGMVISAAEKLVVKSSTEEAYDLFLDVAKRSEEDE